MHAGCVVCIIIFFQGIGNMQSQAVWATRHKNWADLLCTFCDLETDGRKCREIVWSASYNVDGKQRIS